MKNLIQTLESMNNKFGIGEIDLVTFNLVESKPELNKWYGTVTIRRPNLQNDIRMFKATNNFVIFLSRKRKYL